jgi:hypothetical protein
VHERIGVRAAVFTYPPPAHAPDQFLVRHLDLDANHRPPFARDLVERVGLRRRPRKPVEHEAGHRVGPRQPLADDADDQVVADELAAPHHLLDLPAEIGPAVHRLAQDVPGRNLGNPQLACDTFRLRALTRSRRAKHHKVQRHVSRAVPGSASSS